MTSFAQKCEKSIEKLGKILRDLQPLAVGYSGGVDSTFLLWAAVKEQGLENVLAVTAVSPVFPQSEIQEAQQFANGIGVRWVELKTDVLHLPEFRLNPPDRCYCCKTHIFQQIKEYAAAHGFHHVVDGSNADDPGDHRPGLRALRELGIRSPLMEAGLTKEDVRKLSKEAGLPSWDRPSRACLASRIPYGSEITEEKLARVGKAEEFLLEQGLRQVRVRDHYPVARIEVEARDIPSILDDTLRDDIIDKFKEYGYLYITVDLMGFQSGSMNAMIDQTKETY
ncbi:hypothetical protein AMJ86_06250 [bacterium SM23_57]|nr:MAG: hypothetical protein AMJ86_06250 [bacterium SM23_57]